MTRKYIPAREWAEERLKDPEFKAAYDALEDEFALAGALIEARSKADMTQEQVAEAMGTTQTVIARLESGPRHAVHPHPRAVRQGDRNAPAYQFRACETGQPMTGRPMNRSFGSFLR